MVRSLIGGFETDQKLAIGRFPGIDGVEMARTRNITKKLSAAEARVLLEPLYPLPCRAIDFFKSCFTSRLDFELPEDYKHRCPIFRSRIIAFQEHFIRGSLVC